jgi:hypothetical protein
MEGGEPNGQEGKESRKEGSQEGEESEKIIRRGWTSCDGLSPTERNL